MNAAPARRRLRPSAANRLAGIEIIDAAQRLYIPVKRKRMVFETIISRVSVS